MKVVIGAIFFFLNLGGKTNCWLPFVKLQNLSSLPISEVLKSGTHSSAEVCLHIGEKVLLGPGNDLCAVGGQCGVAVASCRSSEVPVWHGRKCMLHPGDDRASVPAVVVR